MTREQSQVGVGTCACNKQGSTLGHGKMLLSERCITIADDTRFADIEASGIPYVIVRYITIHDVTVLSVLMRCLIV